MKTITTTGTTLFHIAATELGDATQWIRIAQLNRISDPMLTGIVSLMIPPLDPAATGGLPSQS